MKAVKLVITLIVLIVVQVIFLYANAQTLYFSAKQFPLTEIPTSNEVTSFSDTDNIYFLIIIEGKSIFDYVNSYNDYSELGLTVATWANDYSVTVKGTDIYDAHAGFTVVQKDDKLFFYSSILPQSDGNYDYTTKDWRDIWIEMPKGMNTVKLYSKDKDLKFKQEITINKTGRYTDQQLKDHFWDASNNATKYFNNIYAQVKDIQDKGLGLSNPYIRGFELYKKYEISIPELSKEDIESYFEDKLDIDITIVKLAAYKPENKWSVMKNEYGNILTKSSPHTLIVYKNETTGWCHYTAFNVLKDYEGDGVYGSPYIEYNVAGLSSGRCNCDNVE